MNEAALRAYLLGKLTESEVALVENRLIEDSDLFSQLEVAEDDLFDAYARGQLDEDERRRFRERFGKNSGRGDFARALAMRTASARVVPFPRRYWIPLSVAATLLLGVYLFPWRNLQPAEPARPAGTVAATAPAAAAPVAVVMHVPLSLGTSRAAGGAASVAIESKTTSADLGIRLNPADGYAVYAVAVRSRDGKVVWDSNSLHAALENGDLMLHAVVPADRLAAGAYEIAVRGGASAASFDDLGFLAIEVTRVP